MKRVTDITELRKDDVVRWCEELLADQPHPFYDCEDPLSMSHDWPVWLRRGVVLGTTDDNGVLLYVIDGPHGLCKRKHWCPLRRIWSKTGERRRAPHPDTLEWADEDLAYVERQERKEQRRMWREEW